MTMDLILAPLITLIIGWMAGKLGTGKKEVTALKRGLQSLLRDKLLENYDKYEAKGYAKTTERDSWINMYNQYHNLGANGVMDDIKEKFLDLPTSKKED